MSTLMDSAAAGISDGQGTPGVGVEGPAAAVIKHGDCWYCGHRYMVQRDGTIKYHDEWRVKSRKLQDGTVKGVAYKTTEECPGGGDRPGPDLEPISSRSA